MSPSVFDKAMNRAASSSSGQTIPAFVFPSVSCSAPAAAAYATATLAVSKQLQCLGRFVEEYSGDDAEGLVLPASGSCDQDVGLGIGNERDQVFLDLRIEYRDLHWPRQQCHEHIDGFHFASLYLHDPIRSEPGGEERGDRWFKREFVAAVLDAFPDRQRQAVLFIVGVVRELNFAEVAPEVIGLRLMKQRHVFVPAIMEEARGIAVVEILLLRTPRRRPGLDHLFLGGDLEPGPDLDPLDDVEFIAETAADDVHHARTRSATEQCRASGSDEPVGQVEGFSLDQLGKVRARGGIHLVCSQSQRRLLIGTEMNEGVRSTTFSAAIDVAEDA